MYEKHAPPALADLSVTVEKNETLCVAGANGCGKSTLLRIIAGCIKPAQGEIITPRCGIVFQDVDHQLFMPTVWEDVAFGILKKGTQPEEAREAALLALRSVEAEHLAEKPPYKLSGGEKQRAALAGILITRPDVLVLDEPSANLDPRARRNLIALLRRLPCTKIIASHDLDLVLDLGDRVLFLREGRVAGESPVSGRTVPGLLADETFLQGIGLELPLTFRAPNFRY
ncbi:MAG: energy-coupling factor ABC transporter ATP-binding protein [Treponema sp.]|nr:energy-coupling factor ABC transporter ATP-binding protein [Treponema sp.]